MNPGDNRQLAKQLITFRPEVERLNPIPWPEGLAPTPQTHAPRETLPKADVLIVTWTVAETQATADVLTPGVPSHAWNKYTHNWDKFQFQIRNGAPARELQRLGLWYQTHIGSKTAVCFKSELHMSQDGPQLPVADLWKQIIGEVKPSLVITTGTAGAIGAEINLADVIVSQRARFHCLREFKKEFGEQSFSCGDPTPLFNAHFVRGELLMRENADKLQPQSSAIPIVRYGPGHDIVTTDFFAFDDSADQYGLQGLGAAVEMGDAVLGWVCSQMQDAPAWVCVRNASDPQIASTDAQGNPVTLAVERKQAAEIYTKFGYWTTVCSAIACWSIVAGM